MSRKNWVFLMGMALMLLALFGPVSAEAVDPLPESEDTAVATVTESGPIARELTDRCRFQSNGNSRDYRVLTDGDVKTYLPFKPNKKKKPGTLLITCREPIGGLEIKVFDKYGRDHEYDLQIKDGGDWVTVDQGGTYLVHWHSLEKPAKEIRILSTGTERLRLSEIRVFGRGEPPAEIERWDTLDKCDILLLSAHPDDEILWFAGLMPTYGGDRGYHLQVAVMAPTGGQRKLELLGAIWHCGVTHYPEFLNFIDKNGQDPETQYELWKGKRRVIGRVVEVIRKHQPEMMITHGLGGEYGHGAHKTCADAAINAVMVSGKSDEYPKSEEKYGTWEVKKLYLHEYDQNTVLCDWEEPLAAFGGKTGYQVAAEAFAFHGSQVRRDWSFEIHGTHDNALFGLYHTLVGQDSGIGDLMEHIPRSAD